MIVPRPVRSNMEIKQAIESVLQFSSRRETLQSRSRPWNIAGNNFPDSGTQLLQSAISSNSN